MVKEHNPKTVFTTEDGREFDTIEQAEQHETLCIALENVRRDTVTLGDLLAQYFKTADGFTFNRMKNGHYYYPQIRHMSRPFLIEVKFYYRNWEYEIDDLHGEPTVNIIYRDPDNRESKERRFSITELYADRKNAERKMVELWEETLKLEREDLNNLRLRLGMEVAQ